jgi:hypothetical protein
LSQYKKIAILLLFLFGHLELFAQLKLHTVIHFSASKSLVSNCHFDSLPQLKVYLSKQLDSLKNEGFIFAYSDSLQALKSDSFVSIVEAQQAYQYLKITTGNLPEQYHPAFYLGLKKKQNKVLFKQWKNGLHAILLQAEQIGFPFASVQLDSIALDSSFACASINFNSGPLIQFDSIACAGQVQMRPQYLIHLSGIKPGIPFNQKLLNKFDYKLNSLPFAQASQPTSIYFYGNKAKPYLVLNPIKANTFDGIIGFAPKSSINNELVLTGDFKLKLCNLWASGLQIETVFKSYLAGSRELQINSEIPYIWKIKLGLNYAFKLLKFDSLYIELNHEFAYRLVDNEALQLNLFYKNNQFSLINADTNWVRLNKSIPKFNDAQSNQLGIDLIYRNVNHIHYPSNGLIFQLKTTSIERQLIKNSIIEAVQFKSSKGEPFSVYSDKNLTSFQFQFFADLKYFIPIKKIFIVKCQFNTALIQANQILQQEQFRLGGLKTLKGFDEQSLFTNKYILANIEWRYLLPQNSSFILFYNQAWMNNQVSISNSNYIASGFGAGMQINTSNGQLSLYYALGKINHAEYNFNAAKIHFGYNQLF